MKRFKRPEAGDTIVEVLIAIVIVATILGGAYATANRSLLATRESQERGEALNLAQGQVEALRGLAMTATTSDPNSIFGSDTMIFCLGGTDGATVETAIESASLTPYAFGQLPSASSDNDANYTRVAGSPCATNPQGNSYNYDIAIDRCDPSDTPAAKPSACPATNVTTGYLFTVHVRWDDTGGGRDEVTLQYRLYEATS